MLSYGGVMVASIFQRASLVTTEGEGFEPSDR